MASVLNYALTLSTSAFTSPLRGATQLVGGLGSAALGAASAITKIGGALGGLAGGVSIFQSLTKAADFESMLAGFQTVLGSAEAANTLIKEIQETAAATPFGVAELAAATRSLLAVTEREKVTTTLKMIGDLASAAQRPIGDLASMYAKIKGSDSIQGEDLNQISDALPGSLQEFVKILGVDSVAAVRKLGEEGAITGAALDKVFSNLTSKGGIAFEAMKAQSQTTTGLVSTLKDGFDTLFIAIGTPINDFLKPIISENIARLDVLNGQVKATLSLLAAASKQGKLGDFLGKGINLAIVSALNTLSGGFNFAVAYLGTALPAVFRAAIDELTSERSTLFFTSVFRGIVELLRSGLESAAANFAGVIGNVILFKSLNENASASALRSENYFTTAKAALAFADVGESAVKLARSLRDADAAGRKAGAAASSTPLIDPAASKGAFKDFLYSVDSKAADALFVPVVTAGQKAVEEVKTLITGPLLRKNPSAAEEKKDLALQQAKALFSQENAILEAKVAGNDKLVTTLEKQAKIEALKLQLIRDQGLSETEALTAAEKRVALENKLTEPKFRGLRNAAESVAARQARRSDADAGAPIGLADRLALENAARRTPVRRGRPLNPERAAAELALGGAGADPGKVARDNAPKKPEPDTSLKLAVEQIRDSLKNLVAA